MVTNSEHIDCINKLYRPNINLKSNFRKDQRRILAKFRSCNVPLAIETGRYTRPKTPVNERTCKYCTSGEVDDETHILINCEFFDDLRYNLFLLASDGNSFFSEYSSEQKLIYLMTADHLQIKVASCLQTMMTRRNMSNI